MHRARAQQAGGPDPVNPALRRCAGFSPSEAVAAQAVLHLRVKALSVPAVLLLFVQHGAWRGARDTRCAAAARRQPARSIRGRGARLRRRRRARACGAVPALLLARGP